MMGGLWHINANTQILKDVLMIFRATHDIWGGLGEHIKCICIIETTSNIRTETSSLTYSYTPGYGKTNIC